MQTTGDEVVEDTPPSKTPVNAVGMDPELLFEERFGKVMTDNDNLLKDKRELEKQLGDLHNRLARLQENNVRHAFESNSHMC